ncbi:GCK domain-containing protein [Pavlovales sp. CCMP2436]|nr:GCK domain-containing protein [Pavlovales sp. CCMP2436]
MHARLLDGDAVWEGVLNLGYVVKVKAPRRGASIALGRVAAQACAPESWQKGACVRECGFCKFMKGGPCRETFVAWEECVERCQKAEADGEKSDFVSECGPLVLALKYCTDEHPEYYGELMADAEDSSKRRAEAAAADVTKQPDADAPKAAAAAPEAAAPKAPVGAAPKAAAAAPEAAAAAPEAAVAAPEAAAATTN